MFKPKFTITNKINNALSRIERVRGFLDAALLSADWIKDMRNRALMLEAHHTTHIEGTQLTLEQSERLINGEKVADVDADDRKELLNYLRAFEFVSKYLGEHKPITEGMIREIHKLLVENVRGNSAAPGEYRKVQNFVVNSKTKEVVYEPPPAYQVPIMMAELIEYLRVERRVSPVLVAGIAQFQLVHIHPFLDGNGRTARLLSTLQLYKCGYDFKKLFTISEYYDRNRSEYYEAIQSVRQNDLDMTGWLEYFTHALEKQMQEVKTQGELVIKTDIIARKHLLSFRQKRLVEFLLQHGSMTIQDVEGLFPEINRRSLQRDLKLLTEKKVIKLIGATHNLSYILMS